MKTFEDILDSLDVETDSDSMFPPKDTKAIPVCVFCSGDIIEDKQDRTFISEFYCIKCGLKYKFLPEIK